MGQASGQPAGGTPALPGGRYRGGTPCYPRSQPGGWVPRFGERAVLGADDLQSLTRNLAQLPVHRHFPQSHHKNRRSFG